VQIEEDEMGNSLMTDVVNEITTAEAEVKAWWTGAETATKNLAASVWADIQAGVAAGFTALKPLGAAQVASVTSWLQDEAAVVIGLVEQQFGGFLSGNIKFSTALSALWTSITTKVIPGLQGVGVTALKSLFSLSTLTTVLQAAFSTMLAIGAI
jgi:hypothetical protein